MGHPRDLVGTADVTYSAARRSLPIPAFLYASAVHRHRGCRRGLSNLVVIFLVKVTVSPASARMSKVASRMAPYSHSCWV
jgi:hypothetical protein